MSDPIDVWRPAAEGARALTPVADGRAAYGEGLWVNQAFSPDVAFRIAFALLVERPGLVLGGGALAWLLFYLPNFASLPTSIASEVARYGGGSAMTATELSLASNVIVIVVYLVAFPFQWIFVAGILKAMARHLEGDDAPAALVWTSWREGLITVLYRLLSGVILAGVLFAVLVPGVAMFVGLVAVHQLDVSVIAALVAGLVALAAWIYVALPLSLGVLPCAIDGAGPIEALRIAWRAGSGARPTLFVFWLGFVVLAIAGACFFCVGGIAAYGLTMAAGAGGWLLYARRSEDLREAPFFVRHPVGWL